MIRLWFGLIGVLPLTVIALAQVPPVPEKADRDATAQPKLVVPHRTQDLGTVIEGDKVTVAWLLENRGNADLVIDRTRASCGCTVVKLSDQDKVIPAGGKLELKADFDSTGRRGPQNKTISLYSNDPTQPTISLEFNANVESLYEMRPAGVLNLRAVRRGQTAERSIDLLPGAGRKAVKVLSVEVPGDSPVTFETEPFEEAGRAGQRIRVKMRDDLALGTVTTEARIQLAVDGVEKGRVISVRGEVVGDLTWHPQLIDATRQVILHGARLAPVTIRSTDQTPFEIQGAEAGPMLQTSIEAVENAPRGTQYTVSLTLREEAPPGPFGTMLEVRTNSLDQPVVRVPVFGLVAAPLEVDPPVIVLRQDGTPVGVRRRIKLQASPQKSLEVTEVRCDHDAVKAVVDKEARTRYPHIRFLEVTLSRDLAEGTHRAVLQVSTSLPEAQQVEIPVIIVVPPRKG